MLRMRACRVTVGRRSLLQLEFLLLLLLFQEEAPRLSNSEANNASLAWSTSNLKSLVIKWMLLRLPTWGLEAAWECERDVRGSGNWEWMTERRRETLRHCPGGRGDEWDCQRPPPRKPFFFLNGTSQAKFGLFKPLRVQRLKDKYVCEPYYWD